MDRIKQQPFPANIPFAQELGLQFLGMGDGAAALALDLEERHMNSWHVTHGGVVMTMLDIVMSMAGRSLDPEARGCVTIEMKNSFLQPGGTTGRRILAKGKLLHHTSSICFCEGELWNDDKLVAKSTGTFKYVKGPGRKSLPDQA